MRHRVYGKHLGRNKDERDALFKSLISSLFLHGTIETSDKKAKAIKGLVDKIINLAKDERSSSLNKNTKRRLESYFGSKDLRERVIKEIIPKLGSRTSGYTSLVKLGARMGDRTMMVKMSLIGAEKLESRVKSQESSKKTEKPIKTKIKAKEKNNKVIRKPSKTTKVKTIMKGVKKS